MTVRRLFDGPIIHPFMDRWMGHNINGPSLIRAPSWLPQPLGRYYLYFADHRGSYIRLATADALSGPWSTVERGSLQLRESFFLEHVGSPDAHVIDDRREIWMYVHGLIDADRTQGTRLAVSYDGVHFIVRPDVLGPPYMRVFDWQGAVYAWAMGGASGGRRTVSLPSQKGRIQAFPPTLGTGRWCLTAM